MWRGFVNALNFGVKCNVEGLTFSELVILREVVVRVGLQLFLYVIV